MKKRQYFCYSVKLHFPSHMENGIKNWVCMKSSEKIRSCWTKKLFVSKYFVVLSWNSYTINSRSVSLICLNLLYPVAISKKQPLKVTKKPNQTGFVKHTFMSRWLGVFPSTPFSDKSTVGLFVAFTKATADLNRHEGYKFYTSDVVFS